MNAFEKLLSYSNAFSDGHLYHGNADHVFSGPGQDLESLGRFVADIHPPVEPFIDPFSRGASIAGIGRKSFNRKIFINDLHTHSNAFRRIGSIRRMDDDGQQIT